MPAFSQSRDRGRLLTPEALARLEQAIQQWQQQNGKRLTYEGWRELTSKITPGGLDPTTLGKIRKGKAKVDRDSIRIALKSLGLTLQESDLISSTTSVGSSAPDPNFVGRDKVLTEIDKLFERNRLVLILGEGGLGKSTVARFYSRKFEPNADFYKLGTVNSSEIANAESLVDRWLQEFFSEEPSRQEFSIKLARLRKYLEKDDRRICFVLDNLEPALVNGKFKPENNRYVDLLEVLSDPLVRSRTLITSREPINESGIKICIYPLPELDVNSWYEYFQIYQIQINEESLTDPNSAINQIHKAYGGNAECMFVLTGDIVNSIEYSKDLEAYWSANREDLLNHPTIETLIQRQFEVLRENNPLAYQLLCRMGCYRYQDAVATVPEEGIIALLWEDEAKPRAKRTLKDLRDRCLIKFSEQEKGYFLHPVMRAEAVSLLKDNCGNWTKEGEQINRKAAEFWTEYIKTVETADDTLKAFEAYYHYLEISDLESAGKVIITPRPDDFDYGVLLGSAFYRFGFAEQMKTSISRLIPENNYLFSSRSLSNLYLLLGDQDWTIGKINKAIESHKNSQSFALEVLEKEADYEMLVIKNISFYNLGLCKFDLGEFKEAFNYFELFKNELEKGGDKKNLGSLLANYGFLAFLNAKSNNINLCYSYIEEYNNLLKDLNIDSSSFVYKHSWNHILGLLLSGLAYVQIGNLEKGQECLISSWEFAQQRSYKKLEGKAKVGISQIKRYQGEYESALIDGEEAVRLLEEVNAKAELAEAQFQLALTYQAMKEFTKSEEFYQKAVDLYTNLEAPRQIERIQQNFLNIIS